MSKMRLFFWTLFSIVIAISIGTILLPIVLDLNDFKPQIQKFLKEKSHLNVDFQSAHLTVLSGFGLVLEKVTIVPEETFSNFFPRQFSMQKLHLKPQFFPLFQKKVIINSLEINDGFVAGLFSKEKNQTYELKNLELKLKDIDAKQKLDIQSSFFLEIQKDAKQLFRAPTKLSGQIILQNFVNEPDEWNVKSSGIVKLSLDHSDIKIKFEEESVKPLKLQLVFSSKLLDLVDFQKFWENNSTEVKSPLELNKEYNKSQNELKSVQENQRSTLNEVLSTSESKAVSDDDSFSVNLIGNVEYLIAKEWKGEKIQWTGKWEPEKMDIRLLKMKIENGDCQGKVQFGLSPLQPTKEGDFKCHNLSLESVGKKLSGKFPQGVSGQVNLTSSWKLVGSESIEKNLDMQGKYELLNLKWMDKNIFDKVTLPPLMKVQLANISSINSLSGNFTIQNGKLHLLATIPNLLCFDAALDNYWQESSVFQVALCSAELPLAESKFFEKLKKELKSIPSLKGLDDKVKEFIKGQGLDLHKLGL